MARMNGKDRGIVEKPKGSGKCWVWIFVNGREKGSLVNLGIGTGSKTGSRI